MTAKIQVRRDTTANWNAGTPPTLDVGEIGLDTDLKQIKIGDNTNNWTALPWLAGTLPSYTSPNTDLNNATNSLQGVYRFSNGSALTNAPAAPIDIKAADGGVSMLVLKHGTTVVQQMWTDGDGTTALPKSYSRVYDGDVSTWRAWVPQNIWGISATEGVDVVAKSITVKDTGTGLTVDGNSTLTGSLTVSGISTLGDANVYGQSPSDWVVVPNGGTSTAPVIRANNDPNTGIYFPAADDIAFTANGVRQLLLDAGGSNQNAAIFNAGATFNSTVDMNSNRISELAAPITNIDAMRPLDIISQNLVSFLIVNSTGTNLQRRASDGTIWTVTIDSSSATFTGPNGTLWTGFILAYGTVSSAFRAVAQYATVSDNGASQYSQTFTCGGSSITGALIVATRYVAGGL